MLFAEVHYTLQPYQDPALDSRQAPQAVPESLCNAIVIEIKGCTEIGSSEQPPSSYVAYKLLDQADTATSTIQHDCNPVFNHFNSFPFSPTPQLLSLLAQSAIDFFIIDDNDQDTSAFLR